MARMFSSQNPPNPSAEHTVFEALKCAYKSRDWKVFYSIHIPNPPGQPREIDFLVFIPKYFCIICLEVKGGSYHLRSRKWYASYSSAPLPKSPHDQAKISMYAVKNDFEQRGFKYFDNKKLSIGCAVAFKDAPEPPSDLPPHLAYSIWSDDVQDSNKLGKKLEDIAKDVSGSRQPTTESEKEKALNYLTDIQQELEGPTMPITKNRIFSSDLDSLRKDLLVLTNDQLHSLRLAKDNPCCVIDGAAGTGKTVLAMELAKQRCEEKGEKIALIC
ncbi:hypothetical protein F4Y59_12700, partial [Candidatus Poribacteria bacterium]|nr:hypothetical protein [Candidatus Poribacteria bacterium]